VSQADVKLALKGEMNSAEQSQDDVWLAFPKLRTIPAPVQIGLLPMLIAQATNLAGGQQEIKCLPCLGLESDGWVKMHKRLDLVPAEASHPIQNNQMPGAKAERALMHRTAT
jgi:hypothetical protein